ncbi:hypothetical protein MCOR27_010896 [Pyricularia oryzae]|uniref:Cytochrome P450 n=1 Tax=Pyricularia grisea TaxID=148305 RepID=A0ABQ8N4Z5_PYRGI|nr:hypothetical protein MCOR01_000444 [Pyricularia oryzae]KAI6291378.1 hypothetical protein MCOR33_010665 [Pyricularia grisea]KAI6252600.1 hypothetical protein MCOR19_010787 [Pyricularia oryzae]KAI6266766.1 hypothetical protein MCOR27_010896 [Pyricularia oryzae]KAI6276565.1 hypothetical protein MCOR26_005565 [Pyricularia oryzae]
MLSNLMRAALLAGISILFYLISVLFYNVFFHPLRNVPGPFLAKITRLWLFYHDYTGNPHNYIRELHARSGPLVRISPNEVSINDAHANTSIYSQSNPWVKPAYHYKAFQSSAAYSIFTELDPGTHAAHLRLLAPVFAQSRVTAPDAQHLLWEKSNAMIRGIRDGNGDRLAERGARGDATVSLVRVFRSYALDIVTTWTFGRCAESLERFESDLFHVFDIAAESVIYFQHFPFLRALIPYIAPLFPKFVPNKLLGQYAAQALRDTRVGVEAGEIDPNQTVFSNLASAAWQEKRGYKPSEGQIISDGIVILAAGADTTAAALSIGMHHLARQPNLWRELQEELRPMMDMFDRRPQIEKLAQLPLLNAVLNEGLRLSCPIRGHMPRVVPSTGWTYRGTYFPPGSVVATSAFYGCYNEDVFPQPYKYDPKRWLNVEKRAEMEAHMQPFSRGTRQCIGQK